MTGTRRLSQAISEGDGISVIVEADGPDAARAAEVAGAAAIVTGGDRLEQARHATTLPIIWRADAGDDAESGARAGADACLVDAHGFEDEDGPATELYTGAVDAGLECVVRVSTGEDLEAALERAGVDGVIVGTGSVADLVGAAPPEV